MHENDQPVIKGSVFQFYFQIIIFLYGFLTSIKEILYERLKRDKYIYDSFFMNKLLMTEQNKDLLKEQQQHWLFHLLTTIPSTRWIQMTLGARRSLIWMLLMPLKITHSSSKHPTNRWFRAGTEVNDASAADAGAKEASWSARRSRSCLKEVQLVLIWIANGLFLPVTRWRTGYHSSSLVSGVGTVWKWCALMRAELPGSAGCSGTSPWKQYLQYTVHVFYRIRVHDVASLQPRLRQVTHLCLTLSLVKCVRSHTHTQFPLPWNNSEWKAAGKFLSSQMVA